MLAGRARNISITERCTIGHFDKGNSERPTLADVRRWTAANWKTTFVVNIFEMLGNSFLLSFLITSVGKDTSE